MLRILYLLGCFALSLEYLMGAQNPLKSAKFTQVVNQVEVVKADGQTRLWPKVSDSFAIPDIIQTGALSRAELLADDKTVARVGANTVFSFSKEDRGIDLKQGTVLFHSPEGKGGGTIRTAGATAAVTGTTIVICATKNGGFKLLVFEGKAKATLTNGKVLNLAAGQLVFILPGRSGFSPVITFDVQRCVEGSKLHTGFEGELPSMDKIQKVVEEQKKQIKEGKAATTDFLIIEVIDDKSFQVVDTSRLEKAIGSRDPSLIASLAGGATVIKNPILDSQYITTPSPYYHLFYNPNESVPHIDFQTATLDLGSFSSGYVMFLANGDIRFNSSLQILNYSNAVFFYADGEIQGLSNKTFTANTTTMAFSAGSEAEMSIVGTTFNLPGALSLSTYGDINLDSTVLNVPTASIYSSGTNSTIRVTNMNFNNVSVLSMTARTINFTNVDFPSSITAVLYTQYGWNIDGTSQPGYANFINSRYNGLPISYGYHGIYSYQGSGQMGATSITALANN